VHTFHCSFHLILRILLALYILKSITSLNWSNGVFLRLEIIFFFEPQNLRFLDCIRSENIPRAFTFTTVDRAPVARSGSRAVVKQRGLVSSNSSKHRRQGWPTKKCHHLAPRPLLLSSPLLSFVRYAPINFLARLSKRWWDHKFHPVPRTGAVINARPTFRGHQRPPQ